MKQQFKSNEIGGYRYIVTQLGAVTGRRIADELARVILPSIIELISRLPEDAVATIAKGGSIDSKLEKLIEAISPADARNALDVALKSLPPSRVDELISQMSQQTFVLGPGFGETGAPLWKNFDEHFAGRYKAMFQWFAFSLKVNFADFFVDSVGEVVDQNLPSTARA